MSIHFPCRRCRQPLTVRRRQAGTPVICPNCKGETLAPSSSESICPPQTTAVLPTPPPAAGLPSGPRLGILVSPRPRPAAPAPVPIPVAKPVAPPPLAAAAPAPAPARARRPWNRSRSRRLLAAAGTVTLLLAVVLSVGAWAKRPRPPSPPDSVEVAQGPEVPAAGLGADDLPDELVDALPPHQEEWVDERPVAAGPDDPAEPVLGPPSGIEVPDLAAKAAVAEAPPLPAPGALARFKRRDRLGEDDLRKQLAGVPEIGLDRSLLPSLVWEYREQQEVSLATYATPDLEPRPLYALYPGVKGLQMRHGRESRLDSRRTATLDLLSRKLRVYVAKLAPANLAGKRPDAARLRAVMYAEMRGPKPEWLRPEAVPVLMQMLTHEDTVLRRLLIEILSEIDHRTATAALAQRALSDLDADLRAFAIEALRRRSPDDYLDVFLRALRHPLPLLADHAAEALVALDAKEAVPALVTMLKEPDPTAPYPSKDGRPLVRELVRTNHLANCLLCHPPSVTYFDPVPGVIPNARWLYPVVEQTPTVTVRTGIQTTVVPVTGTRTVPQPVAAPPRPAAPANPPAPGARPPAPKPPPSTTAQQIINLVNIITSQTTSGGTTTQSGCHDYTADIGTVPGVTVPPTKPKPGGKSPAKPGTPTAPPGNGPSKPANPVVQSPVPRPAAPVVAGGLPRTGPPFRRVPFRGPVVQQTPVVQASVRPQTEVTIINLPVLVRGDVTYLRQDFSVQQPVATPTQPDPVDMRFDYFVRTRRATPDEIRTAKDAEPGRTYEQREAVLFALRGLTGRDAGPTTEAWQQLYPDAEGDSQANRLAAEVARAQGNGRELAVTRLRDGKGTVYTDALAAAVPRLTGPAQEQAREALVQRLARMTAATLRNKLGEDSAEVRRAAAVACARKDDEALVPDLLERLDDAEAPVAQAARLALGQLTGKEFASVREWREWWEKE